VKRGKNLVPPVRGDGTPTAPAKRRLGGGPLPFKLGREGGREYQPCLSPEEKRGLGSDRFRHGLDRIDVLVQKGGKKMTALVLWKKRKN